MDETKANCHFAGEDRDFWLPMSRVVAFEREADLSIFELFYAIGEHLAEALDGKPFLAGGSGARLRQCHSLIRNGLIGAGEGEKEAAEMIKIYCYPSRAAVHDLALAYEILRAAIYGIKVDESAKKKAAEKDSDPSRKAQ